MLFDILNGGSPVILGFILIYVLFLVLWIIKRKSLLSNIALLLTVIYAYTMFILLFIPVGPISAVAAFKANAPVADSFNIIPFKSISEFVYRAKKYGLTWLMVKNIFGNILLFIPFGFLFPCLNRGLQKRRNFILFALLLPTGIELGQFSISLIINAVYRIADIDDVILNFLGILIGFLIFKLLVWILSRFGVDLNTLLFKKRKPLIKKEQNM